MPPPPAASSATSATSFHDAPTGALGSSSSDTRSSSGISGAMNGIEETPPRLFVHQADQLARSGVESQTLFDRDLVPHNGYALLLHWNSEGVEMFPRKGELLGVDSRRRVVRTTKTTEVAFTGKDEDARHLIVQLRRQRLPV